MSSDLLSQTRDAKFKAWLQNKSIREKAIEYLGKLDKRHAQEESSLFEVGVSMCAIDRLLGNNEGSNPQQQQDGEDKGESAVKKAVERINRKNMKDIWMKWAMEHHSFSMVKLSDAEVAGFSGAVKEFLINDEEDRDILVLPSLKYTFPAIPKPNEKPKPLTNDQRQQNMIFMRELRKVWRRAKDEMANRVVEFKAQGMNINNVESERKSKAAGGISSGRSTGSLSSRLDEDDGASNRLEAICLNELGLKRFRQWIEEDEDEKSKREAEALAEKLRDAKSSHEQFVKKKDSLRIRMPDNIAPPSTSAMGFGKEVAGVKPSTKTSQTTVELMAGLGLKFVHATSKGGRGMDGDLEKSRNQLLKMGHVLKENFDPEDRDMYRRELKENTFLKEKVELEKKMKEENAKAFDEWVEQKEMREQAIKCLNLIPKPESTSAEESKHHSIYSQTTTKRYDPEAVRESIDIGKALKKVDRTLYAEWAKWADKVFSANITMVMWDSFPPTACDVHSSAYSQVRDAFLKLLRPGVDFKSTFVEYAEKAIKRRERSADDLDESDRKRMVSELALKKIEMKNLFLQLGIVMKECEMRSLIDSFDTNGDGVITLTEFLDFIGPTRNRRGGNSMVLNQKCCWITTDKTTGMSNAFSVSAPTKKFLRGESKINEEKYETDSKVDNDASSRSVGLINGKIVMRKLANGEQRLCIELPERQKREDILRKFGLLQKGKHSDDDYGEEFEEEHDDYGEDFEGDDHDRSRSPVKKKDDTPKCDYSKWSAQHRRDGLKYLMEITKDARKEEALKAMLANGVPPKAPKFWIETSGGLQVRGKKRIISRNLDDLDEDDPTGSHELQLYWAPQKDDLVSFFSIEFGGQVGVAKIADNQYKEIYRDPIDADPEKTFSFTHMVRNLQPGTSYYFRIRAFNGFGPGDFSYKTFTTKPVAPEFPRVLKLSSNSVSFRWTFSKGFFRRMEELKEIFVLADRDGCGQISREELAAFLDERASSSVELKTFIGKVANSLGIDLSQGYGTLFDMIEGDDDGGLSWEEFESFFLNSGWGNMKSVAHGSQSLRSSMVSGNLTQSVGNHNAVSVKPGDITYVVERCESEIDSIYKEILRTNSGQGTITRLDPGKSYRFRVYSINADGVHGPKSQDIVVHTLLETPPVPTAKVIECRKVVIAWKPRATGTNTRDRAVVDKMLGDWAGTHGENDGGVSIEAAFAKYDKDQTGDIDAAELAYVLEDLGIEVTEDRLSETFALLDKNKDGVISYEEFGLWWRRDEVSYTIKRSEEVEPLQRYTSREVTYGRSVSRSKGRLGAIPEEQSINGGTVASAKVLTSTKARQVGVPIVSYRGSKPRCEIAGLTPNRLYHFKVRYVGSRSNSILSHPLVLMTAPLPPSPPVLVMVTSSTVRIKWYGPQYGGYKFVVHMKQAIGSDSVTGAYGSTRKLTTAIVGVDTGEDGWVNVYNGVENIYTNTSLPSDTSFLVRVMCLNYQGNSSEPSEQLTFTTLKRTDTSHTLTPKNAATSFTIDCTGDICVGDTILITERLFARPHREEDEHAPSIKPALSTNRSIISQGKSKLNDIATLKTGRKSIITKGNSKTNPLNMSTTSIHSVGGVSITPSAGEYLGERTMAVYVSKDNYRSIRDELALMNVTNRNVKKISKFRKLFLEVVWQKNSTEACKQFELKPGEIIERTQDHLEQFVVYRCRWNEENKRRPFADDWDSLTACFIAADC